MLNVEAPRIPEQTQLASSSVNKDSTPMRLHCSFSMASANVLSLYRGRSGHAGKLHYLQEQMRFYQLNCMATHEARSDKGMSCAGNILRFCSGHAQGQGGVELWIDLNCPYAVDPKGKQWRIQKSHFQVVYATERCLLLRCGTGIWAFWLAALHAPHSGASATTRHQWWNNLNDVLSQYLDGAPLFVLIDANGAPGDADGVVVKEKSFATTTNTADFRQMLLQHGLCLPATSEVHQGTNATWTSLDGKTHHCTDHTLLFLKSGMTSAPTLKCCLNSTWQTSTRITRLWRSNFNGKLGTVGTDQNGLHTVSNAMKTMHMMKVSIGRFSKPLTLPGKMMLNTKLRRLPTNCTR